MRPPAMLALVLALPCAAQDTWYVDLDAAGPGTGDRTDPFPILADAVTAAADGDEILVLPGRYSTALTLDQRVLTIRSTAGRDVTTLELERPPTRRSGTRTLPRRTAPR